MTALSKHTLHPKKLVLGPFGPHRAKLVCVKCGVWIKWIGQYELNGE